jgi:nucleotide-binding universal stress UspA family protein
MFKSILVAVDGSRHSLAAVDLAFAVAARVGARVEALFVKDARIIHAPYWRDFGAISLPTARFDAQLNEFFQARGEAVLQALKQKHPGIHGRIEEGRVDDVIVQAARKADLLVLGSAGESHEETGSTTELGGRVMRIIRRAKTPAIVVPEGEHSFQRVRVAFANGLNEKAIVGAKRLGEALGLPVEALELGDGPHNGSARAQLADLPLRSAPGDALDALRSSSEPGDLLVVSDNDLTDLESAIPASRVPVVAYL